MKEVVFFMATEPRLTKTQENVLLKAYGREDRLVVSGAPRVKQALVAVKYITRAGTRPKTGHDLHVLTEAGTARASSLVEARRAARSEIDIRVINKKLAKIKTDILDCMAYVMIDQEIKTFDLPDRWRIRLDRTGPNNLTVTLIKPQDGGLRG